MSKLNWLVVKKIILIILTFTAGMVFADIVFSTSLNWIDYTNKKKKQGSHLPMLLFLMYLVISSLQYRTYVCIMWKRRGVIHAWLLKRASKWLLFDWYEKLLLKRWVYREKFRSIDNWISRHESCWQYWIRVDFSFLTSCEEEV